jgi:tRNA pseudouridine38-40 synthase
VTAKRFAATVSYDGTDFAGSQLQPNARTVQRELELACERLFGAHKRVALAGRTDSGVHATGQVAAFTANTRLDAATTGRALNAHLPEDVSVRDVREVPPDFDPRRWARRRRYRYTIVNSRSRLPLWRRTAWHVEAPLDVAAMQAMADALVGRRDFIACSGPLEQGRSPERTVFEARWCSDGCATYFDIEADAFLPHMVRRITGASVRVGLGSATKEEIAGLLDEAQMGTIGPTAPAKGLCLERVTYDEGYRP